jgi:hypothetical protein
LENGFNVFSGPFAARTGRFPGTNGSIHARAKRIPVNYGKSFQAVSGHHESSLGSANELAFVIEKFTEMRGLAVLVVMKNVLVVV